MNIYFSKDELTRPIHPTAERLIDQLLEEEVARSFVQSIEEAVSDDIKADIQGNSLITTNSIPSRIWDLINRNLINNIDSSRYIAIHIHRGYWEIVVFFDKEKKSIIAFMREKRFAELRRRKQQYPTREARHYLEVLATLCNNDLFVETEPSLFPDYEAQVSNTFYKKSKCEEEVQKLLKDSIDDKNITGRLILILFDTNYFQLTSIRAALITPNLDIVPNSVLDLSQYISSREPVVVDKVSSPMAPQNQPTCGLSLTEKAIERQKTSGIELKEQKDVRKERK